MAQVLRIILFAELILYAASALWCRMVIAWPWPVSLSAALLVPFALRTSLIGATFAVALRHQDQPATPPAGSPTRSESVRCWWRAFVSESIAPIAFMSLYGPFDKLLLRDSVPDKFQAHERAPEQANEQAIVLLVHGYLSNRGIWWRYAHALRRRGNYVAAVDLTPPLASLETFIVALDAAVERHRRLTGRRRVILIAHSMGGLVSRAWLARRVDPEVVLLITIGTPHCGTRLAPMAIGQCAREMRESSKWSGELTAIETPTSRSRIVSIRSSQDNVVVPARSAQLDGAQNIVVDGVGHLATTTDREILTRVLQLVANAGAGSGQHVEQVRMPSNGTH